ncbi:MAG: 50S ribosomal protein L28 [Bacteroidales bacterium]|nr:50S ribosomal protein L28 [Bacteroidales bacterium]
MSKICQITGKKMMVGNHVSHSNRRVKRRFYPNLFTRKFWLAEENRWVTLKVSANGIRTITKNGLASCLKKAKDEGLITKF